MGRWLLILFVVQGLTACDTSTSATDGSEGKNRTLVAWASGWGDIDPPSGSYAEGRTLTLTATPRDGWFFSGWSGDLSGVDNPITLTMDGDRSIVANFYQPTPYANWNPTAVRRVLQTFAWGGFPTDEQIAIWGAMPPEEAIEEMLTFEPTNDKLSPPDVDDLGAKIAAYIPEGAGQLEGIARYFFDNPDGLLNDDVRQEDLAVTNAQSATNAWDIAARARGLNTFYHRIGFWETNYHMATNEVAGVPPHPIMRHYDSIMNALEAGEPYQQVLATGALSSAVAYQYGHNFNRWDSANNWLEGNEDFAREFHQLFFGILGDASIGGEAYHLEHEHVSIKNTAKALTGMNAYIPFDAQGNRAEGTPDVVVDFDAEIGDHHQAALKILDTLITGYSAKEKIETLAEVAIEHPESLNNLPVIIVGGLADSRLTPEKVSAIREMWEALPEKSLLAFLRQYAISDLFHSSDRLKYHSSFDRNLIVHNQMQHGNHELYQGFGGVNPLYTVWAEEQIIPFSPIHNVFGHQTNVEAFNDPEVFKNAYNRSSREISHYEVGEISPAWTPKDWQKLIPPDEDGRWLVKDVARYLWQRFIADGLKHYGPLEQAHLFALLGSRTETQDIQGADLGLYLDESDPTRVYTVADLQTEPTLSKVVALGERELRLDEQDSNKRLNENSCIQRAIAFIAATPYAFLQEGQ